jgi:hypothetical protein
MTPSYLGSFGIRGHVGSPTMPMHGHHGMHLGIVMLLALK